MKGSSASVLLLALVASCGGGGTTTPAVSEAFDVTATLSLMPLNPNGAYWPDFPRTQTLTLVWQASTGAILVGANGVVDSEETTAEGAGHRTKTSFALPVPFEPGCGHKGVVTYRNLTFSVQNGALTGTAGGQADYLVGDQVFSAELTATLAGTTDATPPTFAFLAGEIDPLDPLTIYPSEPIRPFTESVLVGATSGDVVPLFTGDLPNQAHAAVTAFSIGVALRAGETYTMKVDGVTDFAGHAPATAPTFTTRAAPPLVPEDGFESVATPTLGGAGVLRGEPLMPIAGTTSLILNTGVGGGFGFLPYMLGPSLAVRLAVAPGDTVVRFQRRIVATADQPTARFYGATRIASAGGNVGFGPTLETSDLTKVTLPRDGDVYVGGVQTVEIPLPPGTKDELTFEIIGQTDGCGLPPPSTALIIDDLRVE